MNELFVNLISSDNEFLKYPCAGKLELFELGTDGSLICGVWRGQNHDGSFACPVEVRKCVFEYDGGAPKYTPEQINSWLEVVTRAAEEDR